MKIDSVSGSVAPTYRDAQGLICEQVVITEQGTDGGLPIVDFLTGGPDGMLRVLTVTGRLVNSVSAAVRGVNVRNHGVEEP